MKSKSVRLLYFFLVAFIVLSNKSYSFSFKNKVIAKDTTHTQFIGGEKAFHRLLEKKIHYPKFCKENCIQGIVVISFEVDTLGNVNFINVVNSVHELLDEIAVNALKSTSGRWNPASINGHKVTETSRIPISFIYHDNECSEESIENFRKGTYYYEMDSLKLAEKYYLKSFRNNPQNITAIYNCSIIRLKLNDINGACNYLNYIKTLGRKDGDELIKQYCTEK